MSVSYWLTDILILNKILIQYLLICGNQQLVMFSPCESVCVSSQQNVVLETWCDHGWCDPIRTHSSLLCDCGSSAVLSEQENNTAVAANLFLSQYFPWAITLIECMESLSSCKGDRWRIMFGYNIFHLERRLGYIQEIFYKHLRIWWQLTLYGVRLQ